jgi:small-conductance mechanosensitive channel
MTEYLSRWIDSLMLNPPWWINDLDHHPWLELMLQIVAVLLIVAVCDRVALPILQRLARPFPFSRRFLRYGRRAGRTSTFFLLLQIVLRNGEPVLRISPLLMHLTALCTIASLTWLATRCVKSIGDTIIEINPTTTIDNLGARRIHTQTKVLARSMNVLIILIGTGMALMTLPLLRQIGTSLLASAGVAGLIVGFAAKPVLGNLLAGLQLALSQPIRLDDVVIVENEWGQIEEITGTYVVVRIWDQRRMVVPLQWFIEHPFQNWTRTSSELLGTVTIWADYRLPVDPLRAEATRICQGAEEWDGRLCIVQVLDANERAMQLRVLVSAQDAARCFDLRCKVREGLIAYIHLHYPECLPRVRVDEDARQLAAEQ